MADLATLVREFHERGVALEGVIGALNAAVSLEPESPLREAAWAMYGLASRAIDAAFPGADGWLDWWMVECRFGTNPMQARLPNEELRTIATVDDLIRIIEDDLEAARKERTNG